MTGHIPIAGPSISDSEVSAVAEAAANGWYENAGHYVDKFEHEFAAYLGVKHAVAVPHCTSAIHLALVALGIGEGDEVIVPDITWIASAAPLSYVGATPVFADIDPVTWCLSPASVEDCLTGKTRAIIPVGLYGLTPDFDALKSIAKTNDLRIIEDAAQTIGSRYKGKLAGTFGDVGVFSFHGTKLITTGEGGMLVTDDDAVLERVQVLRDHGRTKSNFRMFVNTEVAFKYRMSGLQAAFGSAQLSRIEDLIAKKRQIFRWYKDRLGHVSSIELNAEPDGHFNTFWMTTAIFERDFGTTIPAVMAKLSAAGIDTRPFFHPLSSLPAYEGERQAEAARQRNLVGYDISPRGINLPSALRLTEADIDRVCTEVLKLV